MYAESGSQPRAERKRLESGRKTLWKRIEAVRYDAIVGVGIHDYKRGILQHLGIHGDTLVRKIDQLWPAMTPRSLAVGGARGYGRRSIESEVVTAVGAHLPWLRELGLNSSHRSVFVSEYTVDLPFDGSLFAALAKPGILPRLRSLQVAVTRADATALRAFAESELASRLGGLDVEVRLPETEATQPITANKNHGPNAVRLAIENFLARRA